MCASASRPQAQEPPPLVLGLGGELRLVWVEAVAPCQSMVRPFCLPKECACGLWVS
jgi:hypothetical protein